ncbi:hypothetical protein SKAU_G00282760 [Synaphobranchus kaupii]|uniref:Uncharacterized protein n=1 Tax=Synaphobranchus kaupii TaxID=118154 RepID=A0A9Q1EXG9_SYNKA|nr:hypothetical protein SKAU_G00282760 [Synaphobranchus kaupii]
MAKLNRATMDNLVDERQVGQERLESLETMTRLFNNKEEELAVMASRLEVSERKLADMSQLCQSTEEKLEATMNNLVAERQLGQERLGSLETVTQLLWNNATELEDMSKLCQAKEGKLAEILLVYKVTAENLAKEIEQGEEKMDATEEKLEAMTQLCQSQDKRLEDAAELRRMLETVLQQNIKREESQQLAMERVEEGFETRMSESQRALEEERGEEASLRKKVAYVIGELVDLQKPPSPTPTPGCPTVQETLSVEALDAGEQRLVMSFLMQGEESQESQKQADPQEQMLAQQETGVHRRKEKPRWVKMVFGNYRPNRWFTEEQVIHKPRPSSQTQMASDQRRRGSDAWRPGDQGMGIRDQGGAGHQRPRPREIQWAQHWRAEYNPYRTVKGAFRPVIFSTSLLLPN